MRSSGGSGRGNGSKAAGAVPELGGEAASLKDDGVGSLAWRQPVATSVR
jgi:hypothetical protein